MQQWEYTGRSLDGDEQEQLAELDRMGSMGWELCAKLPGWWIFKRPIGPDWKARCEMAEAALAFVPGAFEEWEKIKNKQ